MARTIVDDSAGWVVVIRRQIWAGNSTTTGLPGAYRTGCIGVSRAQDAPAQVSKLGFDVMGSAKRPMASTSSCEAYIRL